MVEIENFFRQGIDTIPLEYSNKEINFQIAEQATHQANYALDYYRTAVSVDTSESPIYTVNERPLRNLKPGTSEETGKPYAFEYSVVNNSDPRGSVIRQYTFFTDKFTSEGQPILGDFDDFQTYSKYTCYWDQQTFSCSKVDGDDVIHVDWNMMHRDPQQITVEENVRFNTADLVLAEALKSEPDLNKISDPQGISISYGLDKRSVSNHISIQDLPLQIASVSFDRVPLPITDFSKVINSPDSRTITVTGLLNAILLPAELLAQADFTEPVSLPLVSTGSLTFDPKAEIVDVDRTSEDYRAFEAIERTADDKPISVVFVYDEPNRNSKDLGAHVVVVPLD